MSKHDLADISEMAYVDVIAYQKKVSAGGEMKTAIRRFLDDWNNYLDANHDPATLENLISKRAKALRKALEAWANADIAEPDEPEEEMPHRETVVIGRVDYSKFGQTRTVSAYVANAGGGSRSGPIYGWDTDLWVESTEDYYALGSPQLKNKRVLIVTREAWLAGQIVYP